MACAPRSRYPHPKSLPSGEGLAIALTGSNVHIDIKYHSKKNNQHHLRESFRSIYLFHQSRATGTLRLRKQIYPQKYSPNLKQVIFLRYK